MSKFAAFFILFSLFDQAAAQTPAEIHSRIRTARADRNNLAAIAELRTLRRLDPLIFSANNYDYLLARTAEQAGDFALAMTHYEAVSARVSALREYALWHMSRIASATGNFTFERLLLLELKMRYPDSLLLNASENRFARSLFDSANYDRAITAFENISKESTDAPSEASNRNVSIERKNTVLLARAFYQTGKFKQAREIFLRLINDAADPFRPDDHSLESVKGLDLLNGIVGNVGGNASTISENEHIRRARVYQFNREFELARMHYSAIINRFPMGMFVAESMYETGRGFSRQLNFPEALHWFERVLEQFPNHEFAADSMLQAASAYARVGKFRESLLRYQKFIDKYPQDRRVDRAYLNRIDVLRDQGEEIEALKHSQITQEVFRGKTGEAQALFAEARIYISRENWAKALDSLERLKTIENLGGETVPGGTNAGEVAFLRGYVLEQMRRFAEAIDAYLAIPDGRNEYYGWRATERLRFLARNELSRAVLTAKLEELDTAAETMNINDRRKNLQALLRLTVQPDERGKLLDKLKKVYSEIPAYTKIPKLKPPDAGRKEIIRIEKPKLPTNRHSALADELLFLGLYDEAAPEFEASRFGTFNSSQKSDRGTDSDIALLYGRGDRAGRSLAFFALQWQSVPADYQLELLQKDAFESLYPAPFADAVVKYATRFGVDPLFLLAIMRQESRFRPDIRSDASARGLMQFIKATAEKTAGELRRDGFRQYDLYDPSTSILFGSKYISDLFKLFPNQHEAVAAAYNGGEDNMMRWVGRSNSEMPERYVPEIAFSQSKEYAYRVMANYRVYRMFYDENLKPR